MDVWETRRENMRGVIDEKGGVKAVSTLLGFSNSSYLVQMTGPNPSRPITEKSARKFELKLGLASGALDMPLPADYAIRPYSKKRTTERVTSDLDLGAVISAVGQVLHEEKVELPTAKFATLLTLVVNDAKEHGGIVREELIKLLVDLAR